MILLAFRASFSSFAVKVRDHINIPKEGSYMSDIEMLHQDSQNSGKPEYIAGHNNGHVSAVITNGTVNRSLPLNILLLNHENCKYFVENSSKC